MIVIPKYPKKNVFWTKVFNKFNYNAVCPEDCCPEKILIDCNLYNNKYVQIIVYIEAYNEQNIYSFNMR